MAFQIRESTRLALKFYDFRDDTGKEIDWTDGQLEIIDCIVNRGSPPTEQYPKGKNRIEIIASTRYGKSMAVSAGVLIRAVTKPEPWAIVAGTKDKARIIQDYNIMFALNNPIIRTQLMSDESLDRMRMKKNQDELGFKRKGRIKVFSADATKVNQVSNSLMGFGSPNIIEDEAALVPDMLQAKVMRMLGDSTDNFLVKIGNPFNRNHFHRTWNSERYYKIFIDYERGLREGRYTEDFIKEMMEEPLFSILYGCQFPEDGMIDERGWLPLLTELELERAMVDEEPMIGERLLGGDVAGGGRNYSVMVARATNVARLVYRKNEPDTMKYAASVVTTADDYDVKHENIKLDKVGVGKGATDRVKELIFRDVGFSGGESAEQSDRFANLRAEVYWRLREWILAGGKLERNEQWSELGKIRWKPQDGTGKIIIMSKQQMLKDGIDSPDVADSLSMTFFKPTLTLTQRSNYNNPGRSVPNRQHRDDPYE